MTGELCERIEDGDSCLVSFSYSIDNERAGLVGSVHCTQFRVPQDDR